MKLAISTVIACLALALSHGAIASSVSTSSKETAKPIVLAKAKNCESMKGKKKMKCKKSMEKTKG